MDFNHTEERRMLAESLGRYLSDNYAFETRMEIAMSDAGYSPQKWQELAEMGVIGALFSEDKGGFGGAGFDIAVVFEELGRACLLYTSPSPRDLSTSRMPSSA